MPRSTFSVDEARLRQHRLKLLHLLHVPRRLVAPARLALVLGVEPEEGADRVRRIGWVQLAVGGSQLVGLEVEVPPAAVADHDLRQVVGRRAAVLAGRDQLRDEVRLERDGQLGMGVEHEPQQGGA
jgi:hypothetical protein